jgi:hypothetical protein
MRGKDFMTVNSKQQTRWFLAASALSLLIWGCGHKKAAGSDTTAKQPECSSGTSFSCIGSVGCMGMQMCVSGKLTACDCSRNATGGGTAGTNGGNTSGGNGTSGGGGNKPADGGGTPTTPADAGSGNAPMDGSTMTTPPPKDAGGNNNTGNEDCSNGVDDDGDGKIDCADSECGAWICAANAPTGWTGPSLLYEGDAKPPACDGSYGTIAMRGGTAASGDAAQCTCTCSGGGSCASFLAFASGAQGNCSDAACVANVDTSCTELSSSCLSTATSYVQTRLPPGSTSCAAPTQSTSIGDANWAKYALACSPGSAPRRGGCDPGNVCAPPTPFAGHFCIVKQGDQACPSGPYTDRHVYYTAIDDTRDCTACTCDQDCSYSWKIYDDADTSCATPLATKTAAGECVSVTPASGKIRVGVAMSGAGSCMQNGGTATGSVSASDPYTACCLP